MTESPYQKPYDEGYDEGLAAGRAEYAARLAEAERDAKRYRYLRDATGWSIQQWLGLTGVWTEYLSGKSLDRSIDESMPADLGTQADQPDAAPPHACAHAECPEPHWCKEEGKCLAHKWP